MKKTAKKFLAEILFLASNNRNTRCAFHSVKKFTTAHWYYMKSFLALYKTRLMFSRPTKSLTVLHISF